MTTANNKVELYLHSAKWAILLSIFWLLLSGILEPLFLSFGAVSVAVAIFVLNRMDAVDKEQQQIGAVLRIIRYLPWLFGQIFSSSVHVTMLVWGAPNKVSPALAKINVEAVPLNLRTLYANSITLTPGTLSVDLDDREVTVHALQKSSIDKLEHGYIATKIRDIWSDNE